MKKKYRVAILNIMVNATEKVYRKLLKKINDYERKHKI